MTEIDINAFIKTDKIQISGRSDGILKDLRLCVKDIFDVAGYTTGCGNPTWRATHSPAIETASSILLLLAAGANLVGKTHTNELAFSITGENFHYGTPINVNAPGRIPGGSSSGSAAAVAGGLADVGLGSDTGGSVRVPASFCGVYGIRPTHGRVPIDKVMPLAPSFDTVGWFCNRPDILRKVGSILLPHFVAPARPPRLLTASDIFKCVESGVTNALTPAIERLEKAFGKAENVSFDKNHELERYLAAFRILQGYEAWIAHGDWITENHPRFGPGVRERFELASLITSSEVYEANLVRMELRQELETLLEDNAVLILPTAPGIAPFRNTPEKQLDEFRQKIMILTCFAGLSGFPQVSLPLALLGGYPLGLSLMAGSSNDELLLDIAARL